MHCQVIRFPALHKPYLFELPCCSFAALPRKLPWWLQIWVALACDDQNVHRPNCEAPHSIFVGRFAHILQREPTSSTVQCQDSPQPCSCNGLWCGFWCLCIAARTFPTPPFSMNLIGSRKNERKVSCSSNPSQLQADASWNFWIKRIQKVQLMCQVQLKQSCCKIWRYQKSTLRAQPLLIGFGKGPEEKASRQPQFLQLELPNSRQVAYSTRTALLGVGTPEVTSHKKSPNLSKLHFSVIIFQTFLQQSVVFHHFSNIWLLLDWHLRIHRADGL